MQTLKSAKNTNFMDSVAWNAYIKTDSPEPKCYIAWKAVHGSNYTCSIPKVMKKCESGSSSSTGSTVTYINLFYEAHKLHQHKSELLTQSMKLALSAYKICWIVYKWRFVLNILCTLLPEHRLKGSWHSCPRRVNAGNKNTPSMQHPWRRNVTTSMVGLKKRSHTQKCHPKMVNPRVIAGNTEEEESHQFLF